MYQGQNMVVGKIFGDDGYISRYVQINFKAMLQQ